MKETDMGSCHLVNANNRTWVRCELVPRPLDLEARHEGVTVSFRIVAGAVNEDGQFHAIYRC